MKINRQYMVWIAVLGLGMGMVGCGDEDGDSPDANTADASVDVSTTDVLVKLDGNTTDGSADANKDGAAGDGGADAGGDAGGDAAPVATACSDYCDKIGTNCTGANEQYSNKGDCMSACQNKLAWPQGTGNSAANTLSCRDHHAGLAAGSAGNATTHCKHAGPTGGDLCGTLCENYCYLASKNCTGGNAIYADDAACMTACAGFATTGMFGDTMGNTLQCRVYHVNAARDNANVHCPHSGAVPTAFCVPPT